MTTANVTDRQGAIEMITLNLGNLSQVEKFLVDGGYTGKPFATAIAQLCGADVEVVKRDELHKFVVLYRMLKTYADDETTSAKLHRRIGEGGGKCFRTSVYLCVGLLKEHSDG